MATPHRHAIRAIPELRLAAIEDGVEADLALGRDRELVGELRELVARDPLRERLRGQLMLALYRSGRQAEALEVFQEFRRVSLELGLEPAQRSSSSSFRSCAVTRRLTSPAATRRPTREGSSGPSPLARSDRLAGADC